MECVGISQSKHFRKIKCQHSIEPLILDDDTLVFGIQVHPTHHPQYSLWSANGPARGYISVVFNTPHANEALIGCHLVALAARTADAYDDLTFRRKNRKGPADVRESALRPAYDRLGFHIALIGAVENQQAASRSLSAPSSDNQ